MKTIQQYLRECDRSAIINGYIYKYAFNWELMGSEYKDITCGEIVEKYKRTLNDYIDKLIEITPLKKDKEMILMAYHSGEDDDVLFSLFKKEDIMDESLDYVTSYGYEFTEFEDGRNSTDLIKQAEEKGVRFYSVKDCFAANSIEAEKLILLGYGSLTEKEIQEGIECVTSCSL